MNLHHVWSYYEPCVMKPRIFLVGPVDYVKQYLDMILGKFDVRVYTYVMMLL